VFISTSFQNSSIRKRNRKKLSKLEGEDGSGSLIIDANHIQVNDFSAVTMAFDTVSNRSISSVTLQAPTTTVAIPYTLIFPDAGPPAGGTSVRQFQSDGSSAFFPFPQNTVSVSGPSQLLGSGEDALDGSSHVEIALGNNLSIVGNTLHAASSTTVDIIDDAGASSTTKTWSSTKLASTFGGKADTSHTHATTQVTGLDTLLTDLRTDVDAAAAGVFETNLDILTSGSSVVDITVPTSVIHDATTVTLPDYAGTKSITKQIVHGGNVRSLLSMTNAPNATFNTFVGPCYASVEYGTDVFFAGGFQFVTGGHITNIIRFDTLTDTWYDLGNMRLVGSVRALHLVGDDLFVGGSFTSVEHFTVPGNNISTNHIAKYNITVNTWAAIGSFNGLVRAISSDDNDTLFVGGDFTSVTPLFGAPNGLVYFCKLTISNDTWSFVGSRSLGSPVYALYHEVTTTTLFVGGGFPSSASVYDQRIAKYNTVSNVWSALSSVNYISNGTVLTITGNDTGNIFIGGNFSQLTGGGSDPGRFIIFDETTDDFIVPTDKILGIQVSALYIIDGFVFVGGNFATVENTADTVNIAVYDPNSNTWLVVTENIPNGPITSIVAHQTKLFVGGGFTSYGAATASVSYGLVPLETPALITYNSSMVKIVSPGDVATFVNVSLFGSGRVWIEV
jgi:hypothetical protein